MGVSGAPLGVSSREDGVDKDESSDDLSAQAGALAVAKGELVDAAAVAVVVSRLEGFDKSDAANGSKTLSHHVQNCSDQRHLPSQEQPKSHRRVNMSPCAFLQNYISFCYLAPRRKLCWDFLYCHIPVFSSLV